MERAACCTEKKDRSSLTSATPIREDPARIVGQETVQYVSNIYKYYIAYKLLTDHAAEAQKAKAASTATP
jgi:hypothetical protein